MRIIKIMDRIALEYDLIRTNAPNELIKKQLKYNEKKKENGEVVASYDLLEKEGYIVEVIGNTEETMEDIEPDTIYDCYDYIE